MRFRREFSFDVVFFGSDCRESDLEARLSDEFQFDLRRVASRKIAEEIWAVLERKFQKVRFVIAWAETEHPFRSIQPDLHGLADLHLFSNAIKRCGQLACGRADFLIREDLLQQFRMIGSMSHLGDSSR